MRPAEARDAVSSLADRYRVLLDIGRTLSCTLDHADLYREIYRETAEVLEASGFYVAAYDQARDVATIVFYADRGEEKDVSVSYRGTDSEVLRTGRPSLVADRVESGSLLVLGEQGVNGDAVTRSAISAPLRHKGRLIGVISAQSYEPDTYSEADLELLQGIADVAAVALENARFVGELERRTTEAEQIEEIGRALTSSLDTGEVLTKVTEAVLSVMKVDGSSVWLREEGSVRVAASAGEVRLPVGAIWNLEGVLYDQMVRQKADIMVDDIRASELIPDHLRPHLEAGSGIATPILVGGEVAGALSAGSRAARAFHSDDLGVLRRIAAQASVALENARLHASLQTLSLTDPLTGLPNRRHLQMHLQREVAAARRGRSLVVVMFDLDNFKVYNDTAGHLAGDDAIRAFAQILAEENRAMNLVARYGGDEFVSVLSDADAAGAEGYLNRVRTRVEADPLLAPNGITVSAGAQLFEAHSMITMDEVLQAADAALYDEKADKPRPGRR